MKRQAAAPGHRRWHRLALAGIVLLPLLLLAAGLADVAPCPDWFSWEGVPRVAEAAAVLAVPLMLLYGLTAGALLALYWFRPGTSPDTDDLRKGFISFATAFGLGMTGAFVFLMALPSAAGAARAYHVRRIPSRAQPIVTALDRYHNDRGECPSSLDQLVPDYLDSLPGTGMLAFPRFRYERATDTDEWREKRGGMSPPYDLWMEVEPRPDYICLNHMRYWPSERYPDEMFYGFVDRIDGWAYVHE